MRGAVRKSFRSGVRFRAFRPSNSGVGLRQVRAYRKADRERVGVAAPGRRQLTAVPVTADGATFSAGTPQALFDVEVHEPNPPYTTDYAVTADGQRFLVNTVVDPPTHPALTVILNWTSGLKK